MGGGHRARGARHAEPIAMGEECVAKEAADLLPHPAHAGLLVLERAAQILERLATQRRT